MITSCIFDLDGVIVDTAKYHYLAWKRLANKLNFEFTELQSELTKGISRMASLEIILEIGGMTTLFSDTEKEVMASQKNTWYLEFVNKMSTDELLPGVKLFLKELQDNNIKIILGSASKNAKVILNRCHILHLFDAIVDGNMVRKAKPDPEVFILGANILRELPENCIVFEDAQAGIEAATRAKMRSVGVGGSPALFKASMQLETFENFHFTDLLSID